MPETKQAQPESEIQAVEEKLIQWRKIAQSWMHSRKALICLVAFAVASAALFVHVMDGGQWVDVVKFLVPSYMAGNVGDSIASAIKGSGDQN